MRRQVFTLEDGRTGEIGLDNEGNLYLMGATGKRVKILQPASDVDDFVPGVSNLLNVENVIIHNAAYQRMGKQIFVTLHFTATSLQTNDFEPVSGFDITLPIPPNFSTPSDDSETAIWYGPITFVPPVPAEQKVSVHWSTPFAENATVGRQCGIVYVALAD